MSKNTVIFHSADFDGLFSREVARKFLPHDTQFIGWDYGNPKICLDGVEGPVYIIDLSPECLHQHPNIPNGYVPPNVIWIDHHKSALDKWPATIPGYRIDGVAACRLAYQWFIQTDGVNRPPVLPGLWQFQDRTVEEPLAVRLAGEYDIWDKRDPNAEIFQFGLSSRNLTEFDWSQMLSVEKPPIEEIESMAAIGLKDAMYPDGMIIPPTVYGLLKNGSILQAYQQRNDASTMGRSFVTQFEGLTFLCLNTPRCNSLSFSEKDIPQTGHDALMGFYWDGKVWKVSLYHARHNMGIDLSLIAVKYGGGGHRGACGFQTNSVLGASELPFISA